MVKDWPLLAYLASGVASFVVVEGHEAGLGGEGGGGDVVAGGNDSTKQIFASLFSLGLVSVFCEVD